jgi:hypothetical protein
MQFMDFLTWLIDSDSWRHVVHEHEDWKFDALGHAPKSKPIGLARPALHGAFLERRI